MHRRTPLAMGKFPHDKPKSFPNSTIFAITVILAATLACNIDETETITTIFEKYYIIDPPSLLNSLKEGGKNPFTPVETEPMLPLPSQQVSVNWRQTDYLHIVEALYADIWGGTLDGWSLKSPSFALGCTKIDNGFQNAHFRYFKNVKMQEREIRVERSIHIDPRRKSIYILELEYYPRLTDWGSIELAHFSFSADDALEIAENNGGQEKRLAVENVCDITLLLSPDSPRYRGWDVRYSNRDNSKIFRVQIDPFTGKIYFP